MRSTDRRPDFCLAPMLRVGLLGLLLLAGCSDGPPADGEGDTFTFAYQNRVGSAPCIIADEKGFFADEGLTMRTLRFNSGPACSEALFSGSAPAATMGDATAVIAVARHESLRIVGSHANGEHRHRLVGGTNFTYRSPQDLKGRTLAVKKGTSTYGGLLTFLAAHGMEPGDLSIVDMRPSEMPDALTAGSIDCFVASEPTPSLAETRGAVALDTLGGLGNNYPIMIVAHRNAVRNRPDDLTALMRALHRAVLFMEEHPREALTVVADATGLPPDAAASAMERHAYGLTLDPTTVSSLQQTADFMAAQGILPETPDVSQACERRFLPGRKREEE